MGGVAEAHRLTHAVVADRAADAVDRVRRLAAEIRVEVRVGRKRLRILLERLLVDAEMARRAAIHLRHGLEVHVVHDVGQDQLVDLDRRRQEVQERRVEEVILAVARRLRLGDFAQAHLLGAQILDLLLRRADDAGVLRQILRRGVALGRQRLDLKIEILELLGFLHNGVALFRRVGLIRCARRLEVVPIVVVVGLGILIVARRAVEPDLDVIELLLQLVDLGLVR